jgi:hypothetical protein
MNGCISTDGIAPAHALDLRRLTREIVGAACTRVAGRPKDIVDLQELEEQSGITLAIHEIRGHHSVS